MNVRRKHPAGCGAGGSMYVHGEQRRRNFQSKPFHASTAFTLLPPRLRSYRDTGLSSRGPELLSLHVQGFCCPLLQRPASGRATHRGTPQSQGSGDGKRRLLTQAKRGLDSTAEPEPTSRSLPGTTQRGGGGAANETTEEPTNRAEHHHRHPGAAKVNSELHLYMPSSACEDGEHDAETEEIRPPAEEPRSQESEVELKQMDSCSPAFQDPPHTSAEARPAQDPALRSTPRAIFDDIAPEDSEAQLRYKRASRADFC